MSMQLSGSSAPLGAAPQGTAMPQLAADPNAQAGAGPAAAPASPMLKMVGPGLTYGLIGGGGLMALRGGRKAAGAAVERAVQHAGENSLAPDVLKTIFSAARRKWVFGGVAAAAVGGFMLFKNMSGKANAAKAAAAEQAAEAQQQLDPQGQQAGGAGGVDANGEPLPTQQEVDAKNSGISNILTDLRGGSPASGTQQAPPTTAPAAQQTTNPNVLAGGAAGAPTSTPAVGGTNNAAAVGQSGPAPLIGSSLNLAAGIGPNGQPIAVAGTFTISNDLGSFPTAAAASDAINKAMAGLGLGMNDQRFAIIQSGNSFHAVQAGAGGGGKPLQAQQGTVVGWEAKTYTDGDNGGGLQAYSWNAQSGAISQKLTMGQVPFSQGQASAAPSSASPPSAGQTGTAPQGGGGIVQPGAQPTGPSTQGTATAGGGAVASGAGSPGATPFDPASIAGQTFHVRAAVGPSGPIAGGPVQIQYFVSASAGGFGTADEANQVAQQLVQSAPSGDPYKRMITVQGADGAFYLYTGSVVLHDTAPVQQAAPLSVIPA